MLSNSFATCRRAFIPLNEDTTIDVLKAVSPTLLTAISVLSLWAAHTVAPQAYFSVTLQRFLYMLPYFYLPLGVVTIALAVAASKSNGLASHASVLGLVLCAFGIALGAFCGVVMLQFAPKLSALGAAVLIVAPFCLLSIFCLQMLNFTIRKTLCLYCARRLKIVPVGRYDNCGCDSWAWSFSVLKVICRNMVLCPFIFFASCSRSVRAWWNTVRAHRARVDLDPEAGLEMIPMAVHVETQGGFPQGGVDWQWMNSMSRYRMRV